MKNKSCSISGWIIFLRWKMNYLLTRFKINVLRSSFQDFQELKNSFILSIVVTRPFRCHKLQWNTICLTRRWNTTTTNATTEKRETEHFLGPKGTLVTSNSIYCLSLVDLHSVYRLAVYNEVETPTSTFLALRWFFVRNIFVFHPILIILGLFDPSSSIFN